MDLCVSWDAVFDLALGVSTELEDQCRKACEAKEDDRKKRTAVQTFNAEWFQSE